jgi:hypothetical protein
MSEKDHIVSLCGWGPAAFCMHNSLEQTFLSLSPIEEATVPVEILSIIYCKNKVRIYYKKTFDMFLQTLQILFGIFVCDVVTARSCGFLNITRQPRYFGYKNNLYDTKRTCIV